MGKRKKRQGMNKKKNRLRKLKKKFQSQSESKDLKFIEADGEKISAVMLRFVEPYKEDVTSKESFKKLIVLAMVAWNASLLEGEERQEIIDDLKEAIRSSGGQELSQDLDSILGELMQRKERYFADNKRFILDYSVSESRHEYQLSVISTQLGEGQSDNE